MAKQKKPTEEELKMYNELCSKTFSEIEGIPLNVNLEPFTIPAEVTKTHFFGAQVYAGSGKDFGTANVPSKVFIKKYIPGVIGTSDKEDRTGNNFKKEKAVLGLDISLKTAQGERRIYPILYNKGVLGDEEMVIIREYIPGKTIEQVAKDQLADGGKIKWETAAGSPGLSESLHPIALLHVKSPNIAAALSERFLLDLEIGTPEEANPVFISDKRSEKFVTYVDKLVGGLGKRLDDKNKTNLKEAFFDIDRKLVSRKDLLCIIDGELDVFPHHAMLGRIPDAGGVEVGGIVRDLALYSAPIFMKLWGKPEKMLDSVLPAYFNVRAQIEESMKFKETKFNKELVGLGTLFASATGLIRPAAAAEHYRARSKGDLEKEISLYLSTASKWLNSFIGVAGKDYEEAKTIKEILGRCGLETDNYKLVDASKISSGRRASSRTSNNEGAKRLAGVAIGALLLYLRKKNRKT